jgi:hypothetical protein
VNKFLISLGFYCFTRYAPLERDGASTEDSAPCQQLLQKKCFFSAEKNPPFSPNKYYLIFSKIHQIFQVRKPSMPDNMGGNIMFSTLFRTNSYSGTAP